MSCLLGRNAVAIPQPLVLCRVLKTKIGDVVTVLIHLGQEALQQLRASGSKATSIVIIDSCEQMMV